MFNHDGIEKKITDITLSKGQELDNLEYTKDIINISNKKYEDVFKITGDLIDNNSKCNLVPVIKEGILRNNRNGQKHRLYFKIIDDDSNDIKIKFDAYVKTIKDGMLEKHWCGSCIARHSSLYSCNLTSDNNGIITIDGIEIIESSSPTSIITKNLYLDKRNEYIVEKSLEEEGKYLSDNILYFFMVMIYINYTLANPEIKVVEVDENKPTKFASKSSPKEHNTTNHKRKSITINGVRVITESDDVRKIICGKKKYTGTWGVRGHYRHYKNGNVVYIKPYTKGDEGKSDKINKTYKI